MWEDARMLTRGNTASEAGMSRRKIVYVHPSVQPSSAIAYPKQGHSEPGGSLIKQGHEAGASMYGLNKAQDTYVIMC